MNRVYAMIGFGMLYYGLNQAVDSTVRQLMDEASKAIRGEDEDEDDEEKLINMAAQSAMGTLGLAFPLVGAIPEGLMYSGNVDLAPAFKKLSRDFTGAYAATKRTAQGMPLTTREMRSFLNAITLATGIPTSVLAGDFFIEDVLIEGVFDETTQRRLEDRRYMMQDRRENKRH